MVLPSIIDLANKFSLGVTAEGVESEAQMASLKDRDCAAYQSFLFSKAVPVEEFEKLVDL